MSYGLRDKSTSCIPQLARRDIGKRVHTADFELLLPYYCYIFITIVIIVDNSQTWIIHKT